MRCVALVLCSEYVSIIRKSPISFGIEDTSQSSGRPSRALARGYFVTNHFLWYIRYVGGTAAATVTGFILKTILRRDVRPKPQFSHAPRIARVRKSPISFGIEDTSHSAGRPSRALARGYFVTNHFLWCIRYVIPVTPAGNNQSEVII
eukprot:sb/3473689/